MVGLDAYWETVLPFLAKYSYEKEKRVGTGKNLIE
jgi:hypothetical protein